MADEIKLAGVSVSFDGKPVLEEASLCLTAGVTCLLGPSGEGKTTLLRAAAGLMKPERGSVTGTEGLRMAIVFQEDRLLPQSTAFENVTLAADREKAEKRLAQVGLWADRDKLPAELSGGMKRRCALARALAFGGDALMLDEPFTGVDAETADLLMGEIKAEYAGRIVLIVTHDREHALRWADRIYELSGCKLKELLTANG